MNTGLISMSYSEALLKFANERGDTELVASQVRTLQNALACVPELTMVLNSPAGVSDSEKMSLLKNALGHEEMSETLERFLQLVLNNGRMPLVRFFLHTYLMIYYRSKGICRARLVTCTDAPGLEQKVRDFAREKYGKELLLEKAVDPSLIGGFIFEMDDVRMDASVSRQLRRLRKQFRRKNRRLV